ncbi:expressed unknown protein [Seminavis robusta]|uniref:G-protein coupled receptors family 2 profile 2 domain-containing protein n=1 Tax=Seminavis robusta TaxID=568900 RepID=A0A9N8EX84_9STRA|nr:expressed unknown protein [Seminavis robusta]|eukprot:Sro1962_g308110.1 n/a (451) ;mRNA; r:7197-8549
MAHPLSEAQSSAIRIVPRVLAGLSVLGSGSILVSVLSRIVNWPCCRRDRNDCNSNKKNAIVGQTLLLGMSVADFLSSSIYVIGDVMFPVENGGKGNQATCNAQGFFCNFQVAAALYSGFLAWYYCLLIRYRWTPARIGGVFEPCAHVCSWLFVVVTGSTAISMGLYNPHWVRCYIAGPNSNVYFWTFFYVPIWASMLLGSIAMLLIYAKVRKTEEKSVRHTFRQQSMKYLQQSKLSLKAVEQGGADSTNDAPSTDTLPPSTCNVTLGLPPLQQSATLSDLPITRRVAYQGICYTAAFIVMYVFPTTSRTWSSVRNEPPPYPIRLLAVTFVGSQGFFNWLVYYVQPRVYDWIEQRKNRQDSSNNNDNKSRRASFCRNMNRLSSDGGVTTSTGSQPVQQQHEEVKQEQQQPTLQSPAQPEMHGEEQQKEEQSTLQTPTKPEIQLGDSEEFYQ